MSRLPSVPLMIRSIPSTASGFATAEKMLSARSDPTRFTYSSLKMNLATETRTSGRWRRGTMVTELSVSDAFWLV